MPNQRGSIFKLPMTITILLHKNKAGSLVAHALDFSLVSVMPTREQAIEKLRLTVKLYIEYGLSKGRDADIMFPAPARFWDKLSPGAPTVMLEPIMVRHHSTTKRVTVFEAMLADEALQPAVRA